MQNITESYSFKFAYSGMQVERFSTYFRLFFFENFPPATLILTLILDWQKRRADHLGMSSRAQGLREHQASNRLTFAQFDCLDQHSRAPRRYVLLEHAPLLQRRLPGGLPARGFHCSSSELGTLDILHQRFV